MMRDKFNIFKEISNLVYDSGSSEEKFIYNKFLKKSQINPVFMGKINEYNSLKNLVV
jgi:hypothetical protein